MSGLNRKDFDDRLAELNKWQIEQQKKLKAFQEAQRKLLDLEHQNVLNSLSTKNFGQIHNTCKEGVSDIALGDNENEFSLENFKSKECNGIFQLKFPQIQLAEPKSSLFSMNNHTSKSDNFFSDSLENTEESGTNKPRKFLKRGEGLARFRMTLDDFKGPPKIYREKRIKTYLNNKPEPKSNRQVIKTSKSQPKCNRNPVQKMPIKSAPLPVKIYVPENKTKHCNSGRNCESKPTSKSCKKTTQLFPKAPVENLALKPHSIATEWYNAMKEKERTDSGNENVEHKNNSVFESDIENKKDEKELKIFEILEKKVDDASFCSTSSFVDKLMEQSLSSTPAKSFSNSREICTSYSQGLKTLRSQFLGDEQVKRLQELDRIPFESEVISEPGSENDDPDTEKMIPEIEKDETEIKEIQEELEMIRSPKDDPRIPNELPTVTEPQTHKVNKTLLQEYIKDFKKFKFLLAENVHRIEEEEVVYEKEAAPKQLLQTEEKPEQINEHEIALKLQRKGLQDNVKQLLSWDCPPRKRQPKRVVKKTKPKPKLEKSKSAVSKDQSEKIIFNSSLLHERLNELEKEIEIFRKENKNLERLQRECNEERIKLSRERKEFEKEMQEEKEKLEAKITEEQKKLHKERTVFEKYCKQVKNQPTRQEREETAKLKKEIEKLTETLSTKESRWGASQARLRNQIKNLEKENSQLKTEIEKLKKLSMKKVSFENERNLNTKIIHVINSELGKLKPTVIKNANGPSSARHPSLSARGERELAEKPIRRIKSAPNVKKQMEVDFCLTEGLNELDEKALGSVSTDSGIETNGSRYVQRMESVALKDSKMTRDGGDLQRESSSRSPSYEHSGDCPIARKSAESAIESAVREAMFPDEMDTSRKIAEVKNRLERLNLFMSSEKSLENNPVRMVRLPDNEKDSDEEERSFGSEEEEEEDGEREKENDIDSLHCSLKKSINVLYMPRFTHPRAASTRCCLASKSYGPRLSRIARDCRFRIYKRYNCESCAVINLEKSTYSKSDSYTSSYPQKNLVESKLDENGVWEKLYEDGSKEITYPNGNVKKIFPGSKIIRMNYYNGDIKETNVSEGSEKYYYAETKTWHTTYKDGLEVLEFPNGQTERRHADGSAEISFPNGCVRYCDPSGRDEWRFLDGTVIKTNENGHKILLMPNGQKEIHTKDFKRREYPDGTVKILHSDGTQETRYSNGRVRLKDKDGNLVMDSGGIR